MRSFLLYTKVALLLSILIGCGPTPESINVEISILFINELDEEVLVKNKNGEVAFIGVFLLPKEEYLWKWDTIQEAYKDTTSFQTTFEFFKEGTTHDFTEYLDSYTFKVDVYNDCEYIDTCSIK